MKKNEETLNTEEARKLVLEAGKYKDGRERPLTDQNKLIQLAYKKGRDSVTFDKTLDEISKLPFMHKSQFIASMLDKMFTQDKMVNGNETKIDGKCKEFKFEVKLTHNDYIPDTTEKTLKEKAKEEIGG